MDETVEQESVTSVLLPEIIASQEFVTSPDPSWLKFEQKTIFKFQSQDEDGDEDGPPTLGSYMVKACPGIEPCGMRAANPKFWPSPGRFMKLECGCQIVCVDWGTEKIGLLTGKCADLEQVKWIIDHELNHAIDLIRAMSGSNG